MRLNTDECETVLKVLEQCEPWTAGGVRETKQFKKFVEGFRKATESVVETLNGRIERGMNPKTAKNNTYMEIVGY